MHRKILIADYDKLFRNVIKQVFERNNFEVFCTDSIKEAEEISSRVSIDMAIIDLLKNNDDSGFILAYRLRNMRTDLPIIIVTALSSKSGYGFSLQSENERKWIHANLILEKGIIPEQLIKEVFKVLKI